MIREIKGQITAEKHQFAIVVSRFNEFITSKLLAGAIDCLQRHGANEEQITVVYVPGTIEITSVAKKLAETGNYSSVICLGAVIRGATSHYDYVCQQISRGVGQVNWDTGIPTIFGILTCDTIEQAVERAGTKHGNTGVNAAMAAMEMSEVMKQL